MKQEIQNRINQINSGIVPEGYKGTGFGIFPNDWDNKTFGELFTFSGGLGKSREELGENGICYLHYGDMHKNSDMQIVNYSDYESMPKYDIQLKGNEKYLMEDGDVVFVDASEDIPGTSRAVVINNPENKPFISGLHTILAKEKDSLIQKEYKQYLTCPQYIKKQFAKYQVGFKVYGVNTNSMALFTTYYPNNASEQSKIAEVLMACDKAVELQKQYIDKLVLRKKAVMQKLLTPQFDWKLVTLKNVLKERSIFSEKEKGYEHVTLCKEGVMPKTDRYERDFLVVDENKKYKITKVNDICYNPANLKFGVICINKYKEGIFSPIYVTYEVKEGYNADFISYLVTSKNFIEKIRKYEEGSVYERMAVKSSDFLKGKVYIPCLNIQNEIADSVQLLDKQIDLENQKLQLLINRQKSLKQLLLTGIVRVI